MIFSTSFFSMPVASATSMVTVVATPAGEPSSATVETEGAGALSNVLEQSDIDSTLGKMAQDFKAALEAGGIHEKFRLLAVEQRTVRKPLDQILQPLDVAGTRDGPARDRIDVDVALDGSNRVAQDFHRRNQAVERPLSSLLQLIRDEAHERMILRDPFLSGRVPPMTVLEDEPWRCGTKEARCALKPL